MFFRIFVKISMLLVFVLNSAFLYAGDQVFTSFANQMVSLSPAFNPPVLKGIKVYPRNPLRFDFILDKGDEKITNDQLINASTRLIKYFFASLTIPENDLWVNLSPYERNRIVPSFFGQTVMGRCRIIFSSK